MLGKAEALEERIGAAFRVALRPAVNGDKGQNDVFACAQMRKEAFLLKDEADGAPVFEESRFRFRNRDAVEADFA